MNQNITNLKLPKVAGQCWYHQCVLRESHADCCEGGGRNLPVPAVNCDALARQRFEIWVGYPSSDEIKEVTFGAILSFARKDRSHVGSWPGLGEQRAS